MMKTTLDGTTRWEKLKKAHTPPDTWKAFKVHNTDIHSVNSEDIVCRHCFSKPENVADNWKFADAIWSIICLLVSFWIWLECIREHKNFCTSVIKLQLVTVAWSTFIYVVVNDIAGWAKNLQTQSNIKLLIIDRDDCRSLVTVYCTFTVHVFSRLMTCLLFIPGFMLFYLILSLHCVLKNVTLLLLRKLG